MQSHACMTEPPQCLCDVRTVSVCASFSNRTQGGYLLVPRSLSAPMKQSAHVPTFGLGFGLSLIMRVHCLQWINAISICSDTLWLLTLSGTRVHRPTLSHGPTRCAPSPRSLGFVETQVARATTPRCSSVGRLAGGCARLQVSPNRTE